ncbi:uncharacterized protein F4822DRAFT_243209 [Hypoxylon trugodes]|uniref:uncharacterized protein n=1 Tax=Hypoxylon trugodes TaxID=326681 RepID=UPI002193505B|nr:uncharacterized protein F4822DRAFT_243209 [Hypoxylon trugodes]KAI1388361.1 hypothetical protein F4822DRAFT_243209 [Hypoxylon trugodes]
MSAANNDTPMTRFLFAILRQKNLKDIDWNRVAHDPVLSQEITNGHAARMRFSRFRTTMLGTEVVRRNRTTQPKSRVSKAKKEPRMKKTELVKLEPAPDSPVFREPTETPAPEIKQENSPYNYNRFTPRLTPGPGPGPSPIEKVVPNTPAMIQPRYLTPASDIDMFSPSPSLTPSPVGDMMSAHTSFDFRGSPCPERPDPMWSAVPSYTSYPPSYSIDDYGMRPCDHPHMYQTTHMRADFTSLSPSPEADYVHIKREDVGQYN